MPNKRQPPAKRGPTRDNSRNIAVHMTEEQYQRLQKYMRLTRHGITLYFRKLIHGDRMLGNQAEPERNMHTGVNMIYSNVRQIACNRLAKETDAEAVARLEYLADRLSEEIYLLSCREKPSPDDGLSDALRDVGPKRQKRQMTGK